MCETRGYRGRRPLTIERAKSWGGPIPPRLLVELGGEFDRHSRALERRRPVPAAGPGHEPGCGIDRLDCADGCSIAFAEAHGLPVHRREPDQR